MKTQIQKAAGAAMNQPTAKTVTDPIQAAGTAHDAGIRDIRSKIRIRSLATCQSKSLVNERRSVNGTDLYSLYCDESEIGSSIFSTICC